MNGPDDKNIKYLLDLLDDENDQTAMMAMAELAAADSQRLEPLLRSLQGTPDQRLRRRINQLQSAISRRTGRRQLAEEFGKKEMPLYDGMVELHLLWYDNDTAEEVDDQFREFLSDYDTYPADVPSILAYLHEKIPVCYGHGDQLPAEALCIGTIMEDGIAADFMLCSMAAIIAVSLGVKDTCVVSLGSDFALLSQKKLYFPKQNWSMAPLQSRIREVRIWSPPELLEMLASSLFINAVLTDGYRYMHTIACCEASSEDMSFLPYPYGKRK